LAFINKSKVDYYLATIMRFDFKHTAYSILLHPASLAIPIAAVIILLLPDIFSKYSVSLINEIQLSDQENRAYYDLNHDGFSEMLAAGPDNVGGSGIAVYSYGYTAQSHWIFDGSFIEKEPFCMVGDYDNNGLDEVYALTLKHDSVLMNAFNPGRYPGFIAHNRFITRVKAFNGFYQVKFDPVTFTDLNGDGYQEVVFSLYSGWAGEPRRIYAYNVLYDSLISSPALGGHGQVSDIADIDRDGKMEFTVTNYASGNIDDTCQLMHDQSAYVIVLDHNLQFLFLPIANPGKYNSVVNYFLKKGNHYSIVSFWTNIQNVKGRKPVKFYNIKGQLIKEENIEIKDSTSAMPFIKIQKDNNRSDFVLLQLNDETRIFDENFNEKGTIHPKFVNYDYYHYDFDHDGHTELLYRTKRLGKWIILRDNYKDPIEVDLAGLSVIHRFFTKFNGNKKPYFCIDGAHKQYIMQYGFNRNYYWRYPLYAGIYFVTFLFLALVTSLQKKQLKKKLETEKHITELQLSSIHSQMDSHFTFNVLNTIGSAILQEKKDSAYELLTRFSRLLRATLSDSEKVTRRLEDEVTFVRNFLQIQKSRFKEAFDFEIFEDPDIDTVQLVPKGCIQTYVENAIKHGLSTRTAGGTIIIQILRIQGKILITVRDNGVGRAKAAINVQTSTGKGLKLMHQYYEILNRNNTEKITEQINDLFDNDGNPIGTEVIITIPEMFNFGNAELNAANNQ